MDMNDVAPDTKIANDLLKPAGSFLKNVLRQDFPFPFRGLG